MCSDDIANINKEGKRDDNSITYDGLNPAHVPCERVNNPTLGDFGDNMIGRADSEESKSNCNREEREKYICENYCLDFIKMVKRYWDRLL